MTLVPMSRTFTVWLRMLRRSPVPALVAVLLFTGWIAILGVLPSSVTDWVGSASWVVAVVAFVPARRRMLSAALPWASGLVPGRAGIDVRPGAPAPPGWEWNSPLGRASAAGGVVAVAATCGFVVGAVVAGADGSGSGIGLAVILGFCALLGSGGAWISFGEIPQGCRHIVRHGAPTTVTVLGIEHDEQRWHVELADDAGIVVLEAFRGRSRLVAGDVVHLWQAPERKDPMYRRVALTGPFGTLWPSLPDLPVTHTGRDGREVIRSPEATGHGC